MDSKPTQARDSIGLLAAEMEATLASHPSPEELVAYHQSQLDTGKREAVEEHVTICRECAALLLDLSTLMEDPSEQSAVEVEAVGQSSRGPSERPGRAFPAAPHAIQASRAAGGASRYWAALAAALFVLLIGAGLWIATLLPNTASPRNGQASEAELRALRAQITELERTVSQQTQRLEQAKRLGEDLEQQRDQERDRVADLRELEAPQLSAPTIDLYPAGYLRSGEAPKTLTLTDSQTRFVVTLTPSRLGAFDDYRLEIRDVGGQEVWADSGLQPTSSGLFEILLSRRWLTGEEYRLRLFGIEGANATALGEFTLRIASQG